MAEGAAPESPGHLGPVQLDGRITFSQRLVDYVFDAIGVRVYYRTREKWGKGYFWTLKGPKGRLTEALELVCKYGESYAHGYADAAAGLPPRGPHPPTSPPPIYIEDRHRHAESV